MVWEAADRICGKRLKAALPHLVESMERHGHLDLDPGVRQRLLSASAATLDRLLQPIRTPTASRQLRRRRQQSPGRNIPVRTSSPIGMRRHRDSWRLTWWSTTAAPGAPGSMHPQPGGHRYLHRLDRGRATAGP